MDNFWNGKHSLATQSGELYDKLVPTMGHCDTVQGELIRASTKIQYDWYNNGWGCNNWSGAVVFLKKHLGEFDGKRTDDERAKFKAAINLAHDHSHGESVRESDNLIDAAVTVIHAYVVQSVLDNPALLTNEIDMYDYSEPDVRDDEEDEHSDWDEEYED